MVSFRVGSEDAEFLIKEFGTVFNEYDMVNVGRGGFIKLLVDGQTTRPFSLQTIWPLLGNYQEGLAMIDKFGRDTGIKVRTFGPERPMTEIVELVVKT